MACLLWGCGKSDGPPQAEAHGHVTIDGSEVELGSISFHPTGETKGMVAGGIIKEGRYTISVARGPAIGTNRVEIQASRKSGKKIPDPYGSPGQMIEETVELVPEKSNSEPTLIREIQAGENTLDFDLRTDR